MKIAHLILVHKNPSQVEILVDLLSHPQFDIYIHVDKKSDLGEYLFLDKKPNVFFIEERVKIHWGDYGTIAATINGYKQILKKKYDYINVISGQDLPIKSSQQLIDFLAEDKNIQHITCESVDTEWTEAAPRVYRYHFVNWRIPGRYRLNKYVNLFMPRRKFPLDYQIVGRSNWFTITADAAMYLLDFLKENKNVIRFFKYCWGADEIMFPTILYNSPFKNKISKNLVYADWTERKAHPKLLTIQDIEQLRQSDKFFARKFDQTVDARIIEELRTEFAENLN